jgi:hypothetical protein
VDRVLKAAQMQRWGDVAAALDAGFPVNARGQVVGATLLTWAAMGGHLPTLTRLLAAGADVNSRDAKGGATPACHAASSGHVEALVALVRAGADVNAATDSGVTPLHCAEGSVRCTRFLLSLRQTDLTAVTRDGETAEQYARRLHRLEVARAIAKVRGGVGRACAIRIPAPAACVCVFMFVCALLLCVACVAAHARRRHVPDGAGYGSLGWGWLLLPARRRPPSTFPPCQHRVTWRR